MGIYTDESPAYRTALYRLYADCLIPRFKHYEILAIQYGPCLIAKSIIASCPPL